MLEISSPRVHPLLVRAIVYKILHIRASFKPRVYSHTGLSSQPDVQVAVPFAGMSDCI